jgi:hypothetical protein
MRHPPEPLENSNFRKPSCSISAISHQLSLRRPSKSSGKTPALTRSADNGISANGEILETINIQSISRVGDCPRHRCAPYFDSQPRSTFRMIASSTSSIFLGMEMSRAVISHAERDEVFFGVISELPQRLDLVKLQISRHVAIPAAPPIAREYLTGEPAIRVGFKP